MINRRQSWNRVQWGCSSRLQGGILDTPETFAGISWTRCQIYFSIRRRDTTAISGTKIQTYLESMQRNNSITHVLALETHLLTRRSKISCVEFSTNMAWWINFS